MGVCQTKLQTETQMLWNRFESAIDSFEFQKDSLEGDFVQFLRSIESIGEAARKWEAAYQESCDDEIQMPDGLPDGRGCRPAPKKSLSGVCRHRRQQKKRGGRFKPGESMLTASVTDASA